MQHALGLGNASNIADALACALEFTAAKEDSNIHFLVNRIRHFPQNKSGISLNRDNHLTEILPQIKELVKNSMGSSIQIRNTWNYGLVRHI